MNYLFYLSHSYSYAILRPLQREILRRGDAVAWFLEPTCPDYLEEGEQRLGTLKEVRQWNPRAVFAPGNWIPDFFPGVKVQLFHGFPINKRGDRVDDHFRLRGWFHLLCTQGPTSTGPFRQLEQRKGYFRVAETGWAKTDDLMRIVWQQPAPEHVPTIFVATTFSRNISSLEVLYPVISRLAKERPWRWIITLHPKLTDPALRQRYEALDAENANVSFVPVLHGTDEMSQSDVMLCDASSIILEYMLTDRPVVTYRNTQPGPHLLNVTETDAVEAALEEALSRPEPLMNAMRSYIASHEAHRDGHNCERILDAVDQFLANDYGRLARRPLNLWRRLKMRLKFFSTTRKA